MSSRDLIFSEGTSNKFWSIEVTGKTFTVRFGRINSPGRATTTAFATAAVCNQAAARLVEQKLAKGYRDRPRASGEIQPKTSSASANATTRSLDKAVTTAVARVVAVVKRLAEADPEDGMYKAKAGKPASANALAAYEKRLGRTLPPSYRAFLAQHNGYRGLNVHGDFVSIAEASAGGACHRQVMELKAWNGPGDVDWDAIIPIATVEGQHDFVYLDPARVGPGGELGVVVWYHDDESEHYADLLAYLHAVATRGDELARDLPRMRQQEAIADQRRDEERKQVAVAAAALEDAARLSSLPIKEVQQAPLIGRELPHLHKRDLRAVAFSPDGTTIVVGEDDGPVRWWDVRTGKLLETQTLPTSPFQLESVRAGWALVAEKTITIRGAERSAPSTELDCDEATHILQSAVGDQVVGVSRRALVSWATDSWQPMATQRIKREVRDLAFAGGGAWIAGLESGDREIGLWNARTLQPMGALRAAEKLQALATGGTGDLVVAAGGKSTVFVWRGSEPSCTSWSAGESFIQWLTISPDDRVLVSSACGDLRAWRLLDGQPLARWKGCGNNARLRFSPDGALLAEVGEQLRVWTVPVDWTR